MMLPGLRRQGRCAIGDVAGEVLTELFLFPLETMVRRPRRTRLLVRIVFLIFPHGNRGKRRDACERWSQRDTCHSGRRGIEGNYPPDDAQHPRRTYICLSLTSDLHTPIFFFCEKQTPLAVIRFHCFCFCTAKMTKNRSLVTSDLIEDI
jgi:hypothetical protein